MKRLPFTLSPLAFSVVAASLLLSGCNNDTGSTVLPGTGEDHHNHDHGLTVSASKVATDLRVTQIAAHGQLDDIVAFATGNQVMYVIDPDHGHVHEVDWSEGEGATRSRHLFDAEGKHLLILDTDGHLHILDSHDWEREAKLDLLTADAVASARITVSQVDHRAYITDTVNNQIIVVDIDHKELEEPIALDGIALSSAGIAWLGAVEDAHDEHDEDDHHDDDHGHAHSTSEDVDGEEHDDEHHHDEHHPGRLVFGNDDGHLHVYDLEHNELLADNFALDFPAHAIHASAGYRYAVITQRPENHPHQVQFLDGGLYFHGDHLDEDQPRLLSFRLFGERPAHYNAHGGQSALFFDGGTSGPRFSVLSDHSIDEHRAVASEQTLPAHHGLALPLPGHVVSSNADRDGVLLWEEHNGQYHLEVTFEEPCLGLHGGGLSAHYAAFGCEDGVLLVSAELDHEHDHDDEHDDADDHGHDHDH